jgi:muramidase (phage lysozyme)
MAHLGMSDNGQMDEDADFLLAGLALGAVAFLIARQQNQPWFEETGTYAVDEYGQQTGTSEGATVQYAPEVNPEETGGFFDVGLPGDGFFKGMIGTMRIKDVRPEMLYNPNVQAFLRVIRTGEGTADSGGYSRLFGGGQFTSFAWHPNVRVPYGATYSTAAGAYQIVKKTWEWIAQELGLKDFSPASQDMAALALLAYRGALDDVLAGNFDAALRKASKEWASLPYSTAGQPKISLAKAQQIFFDGGGTVTT